MRRTRLLLAGFLLLAVSIAGVMHSLRVEAAQILYFRCKYGAFKGQPESIRVAAERAHALYPHNYFLCIFAAELAYYGRFDAKYAERPEQLELADLWCRRGMAINPYKSQLRMLDMRLTERHSLSDALRKWEAFVDWQYWDPYNHFVLIELYGKAGRYKEGLASLELLAGREYYEQGREMLRAAWEAEKQSLTEWQGRKVLP